MSSETGSPSYIEQMNLLVYVGSTREGRMCERVSKYVVSYLESSTPHKVHVIDPLKYDMANWRNPFHFYADASKIPEDLKQLNELVKAADAYLVLTAEYNRCPPFALLQLLDYIPPASYFGKSSGIISYSQGPQGGAVANCDLRRKLVEIGCPPVKAYCCIPTVQKAIEADGTVVEERVKSSVATVVKQLGWWGTATKRMRRENGPPPEH
jgi:NAD(P)H-dependent FMN reductase